MTDLKQCFILCKWVFGCIGPGSIASAILGSPHAVQTEQNTLWKGRRACWKVPRDTKWPENPVAVPFPPPSSPMVCTRPHLALFLSRNRNLLISDSHLLWTQSMNSTFVPEWDLYPSSLDPRWLRDNAFNPTVSPLCSTLFYIPQPHCSSCWIIMHPWILSWTVAICSYLLAIYSNRKFMALLFHFQALIKN